MALLTKKGTFVAETGTGNKAYTGVGFQPKALLLFCTAQTAFGSFSAHQVLAIGFSDGTTEYSCTTFSLDAAATSDAHRRHASKILTCFDTAGVLNFEASLVSFDADGFTLNYTDAASSAWQIHYFAIGGDSLTNAKVALFQNATVIGYQAITGTGFFPDCLLFIGAMNSNQSPSPAPPSTATNAGFLQMGFAARGAPSQGGVTTFTEDAAATSDTANSTAASYALQGIYNKSGSPAGEGQAYVASWDVDGFTLHWSAGTLVASYIGYLALKGGDYEVLLDFSPLATGTQALDSVGFQPTGCLMLAGGVGNAVEADGRFCLGAASAAGIEGFIAGCDNDAAADMQADMLTKNDKVIGHVNPGTPTLLTAADVASFDADSLTLNWTTVDASYAWPFMALVMGPPPTTTDRRRMLAQVI